MQLGIECLLCEDPQQALAYAGQLDELNHERRYIEGEMKEQAENALGAIAFSKTLPLGLCLYDERWHQGVVGILASRLKDRYRRPTLALALGDDGHIKGSARSIPQVHIRDVLAEIACQYPSIVLRYGGHAMAAGITLDADGLEIFIQAFANTVHKHLEGRLPQAELLSDGPLSAAEISTETAYMLHYAGPWGQGFPRPSFDGEFRVCQQRIVGGTHLRLTLETDDGCSRVEGIYFRWGTQAIASEHVHLVYQLELNNYLGKEAPQLIIEHLTCI
jgi:single-stranded-DNA-specific exonuclease